MWRGRLCFHDTDRLVRAAIADVDARSGDELVHLRIAAPAERASERAEQHLNLQVRLTTFAKATAVKKPDTSSDYRLQRAADACRRRDLFRLRREVLSRVDEPVFLESVLLVVQLPVTAGPG